MFSHAHGKSRRSPGAEFRAVAWLVRHPGSVAAPAAVAASITELGLTGTGSVLGGAALGVGAWYRAHPDTFDTVAAPVLRAWRRRWAGAYTGRRWADLMAACELTRVHHRTGRTLVPRVVRVRSWSPSIDTVRVKLVPGQSPRAFIAEAEEIASTLKAERVAVERGKPGEVVLIVQRDEPFTYLVPAPELPADVADVDLTSLYMGEDEFGREFREPLIGSHYLRAGATGSGKNSLPAIKLREVAPLIRAGLVRPWVCDPKMLEWIALKPMLDGRYAATPEDCAELVDAYVANMERKQKRMQRAGLRSVPVSEDYPLDWLICDEIGSLLAYRSDYANHLTGQLSLITSLGRSTHDVVEALVQEPSKDVVPIRDLIPRRLCLRVTSERHPDMVLGDGAREKGAIADEIPDSEDTAGIGFSVSPRTRAPRRIRAAFTPDGGLTELVEFVTGRGLRAVS
ncbi:cell division protein FtsK [Umezawaea beigongshangensis]|uniref:cell division protein FtsK n=1 Tax=Umezawaea beigongshangensis TaxID=2780383 RepID=UPI0018F1F190|nr:cell division protein FtsK [Umezawaea beigongshangensis]